jgi:hypothetical protein
VCRARQAKGGRFQPTRLEGELNIKYPNVSAICIHNDAALVGSALLVPTASAAKVPGFLVLPGKLLLEMYHNKVNSVPQDGRIIEVG